MSNRGSPPLGTEHKTTYRIERAATLKKQASFDQALEWLSRTIAVLIFMLGPGLIGWWLDRKLGTSLLTPIGFLVGMVLATTALLALAKKLAPPARGNPIPFEDEGEEEDEDWVEKDPSNLRS